VIEQKLQIGRQLQQELGLSQAQAAGVLGNFVRESNLNPRINEGGAVGLPARRGGYGLAQWTGSRQNDLIRFAGSDERAGDLNTQIAFLKQELQGSERKAYDNLLKAQTPEEAALVFERDFERAGIKANDQRVAAARKAYEVLGQDGGGGGALAVGTGAAPSGQDPIRLAGQALEGLGTPQNPDNPLVDVALAAIGSGRRGFAGSPGYRQSLAEAVEPMQGIQQRSLEDDYMNAAMAIFAPPAASAASQPSMVTAGSGGMPAMAGGSGANGPIKVGRIADPSEDVFPTTGAHLDVRVMTPDGKYINPKTARSTLQHLRVAGKPLYEQRGEDWLATQPVTSGFGPRQAPTAGASTLHKGVDYGIAAHTPLEWAGGGQYSFEGGIGRIRLPDGTTVKLLHTRPS
jgi:murein DD-endopeptidase MepM/ murein hydrolase activator NlpD